MNHLKFMRVICCYIVLFFKVMHTSLGQGIDPLIKQQTIQIQTIPGDETSWENSERNFNSYNAFDEISYTRSQVWNNAEKKWHTNFENRNAYNDQGQRIHYWSRNYNDAGEVTFQWNSYRKYQGNLRVESHVFSEDYVKNLSEELLIKYSYDQNEKLTQQISEFWDKQGVHWKHIENYYFNENGCEIAKSDFQTTYFLQDDYTIADSVYTFYTTNCDIVFEQYYKMNITSDQFENYYNYKIDREYNDKEQVILEVFSEKSFENPEWEVFAEYVYERDPFNRIISNMYTNTRTGYRTLEEAEYNNNGQVILQNNKLWNPDLNDWDNLYIYSVNYAFDTLLSSYLLEYNWNKNTGEFDHYFSSLYDYDENNFLIKRTLSQRDINNVNQEKFFARQEWVYDNRCDGIVQYLTKTETEKENTPGVFYPTREIYEYYRNAFCEPTRHEGEEIVVFPNPSRGEVNIYNAENFGESMISVTDYKGKRVFEAKIDLANYFSLDLKGLPSGLYVLNISNKNTQASQKIMLLN